MCSIFVCFPERLVPEDDYLCNNWHTGTDVSSGNAVVNKRINRVIEFWCSNDFENQKSRCTEIKAIRYVFSPLKLHTYVYWVVSLFILLQTFRRNMQSNE